MIRPVINNKNCQGQEELRKNKIITKKIALVKPSVNSSCPDIFAVNKKKRSIFTQKKNLEPYDCKIYF